jgi:hypothetical protein
MNRFFVFYLLLFLSSTGYASDWELEKDKNGIKVYTRKTEGNDIKEFKAFATINAPRLKIAHVLTRASDYMNWMPDVSESRVLKEVSKSKRVVYYIIDLPWPTDDRDVVLDLWVESNKEEKSTTIHMRQNLTTKKEVDGIVRMKKTTGFWKLTSLSENKTKVHYQFIGDPGGSVPAWLVNLLIVDGPFDSIEALREKVE